MLTHLFDVLQYANGKGSVSYTEENTVKNKEKQKGQSIQQKEKIHYAKKQH